MGKAEYQTTQFIRCSKCPQARFGKRRTLSAQSEVQYRVHLLYIHTVQARLTLPRISGNKEVAQVVKWKLGSLQVKVSLLSDRGFQRSGTAENLGRLRISHKQSNQPLKPANPLCPS